MRSVFLLAPAAVVAALGVLVACGSDSGTTGAGPGNDGGSPDDDSGTVDPPGSPDAGGDGATGGSKVTATDETLTVAGASRAYTLAVPTNLDPAKTYPLVLFLHGDGGDGPSMRAAFTFDDATGDEAIVAYPSGNGQTWDLYTAYDQNSDQQFVVALVDALAGKYKIDKTRVFGAGYSSGGFQINQLACRRAGLFRGINVFAGGAPDEPNIANPPKYPNGQLQCPGEQPVAAFVVHGTADKGVDPGSGDYDAQYWAYVNGCKDTRSATTPSPCVIHDGCPTGEPVVWCLVPGLNHFPWMPGAQAAWALFKTL